MFAAFYIASVFNGDVSTWDTSQVTNMGLSTCSSLPFLAPFVTFLISFLKMKIIFSEITTLTHSSFFSRHFCVVLLLFFVRVARSLASGVCSV